MEVLLKQKRVLKSKLSRLANVVESSTNLSRSDCVLYKEKANNLESDLNKLLNELSVESDDIQYEVYAKEFDELDEKIHSIKAKLLNTDLNSVVIEGSSSQLKSDLRLPKISLPSFSGNYDQWISFHDLFSSTIHQNETLSGAQKLQYLKASLKGDAALLIQSIPITNANYLVAWDIMVKRYQNVREIFSAHMAKLLNQASISNNSASELRRLVDTTNECVRAMKVHGAPVEHWDLVLVHIISKLIDKVSRQEWELSLTREELPTFDKFMQFLDLRAHALSVAGSSSKAINIPNKGNKITSVHHGIVDKECLQCKQQHAIYKCPVFLKLSIAERSEMVKKAKVCFNCFRSGHLAKFCKGGKCNKCNKRHNTLLHLDKLPPESAPETNAVVSQESDLESSQEITTTLCHQNRDKRKTQVLLSTALIHVKSALGQLIVCRALLDSASQASFITVQCLKRLGLKEAKVAVSVKGLGANQALVAKGSHQLSISSILQPDLVYNVEMLVIPKISSVQPVSLFKEDNWPHLQLLQLADPTYNIPGKIDILLGADIYGELMKEGVSKGLDGSPIALETSLGWILTGRVVTVMQVQQTLSLFVHGDFEELVKQFWEVDVNGDKTLLSEQEKNCEQHFRMTYQREESGRFSLCLPFKSNKGEWGHSRNIAKQRLLQLERKLEKLPKQAEQYRVFLQEYLDLGQMELVDSGDEVLAIHNVYYLPHHAVLRPESSSTKLRVVFDGSAKSSNGISLNDTLMIGSKIQDDIIPILLRFRTYAIAMVADIKKMYRQIIIQPQDRNYLRILWRPGSNQDIQEYRLKTVTYGTSCAPFQAKRCLQQLAEDGEVQWPDAAEVLNQDFYMDDLLTSVETETEALQLQANLISLLLSAGFHLCKWSSNCASILEAVPIVDREISLPLNMGNSQSIKSLGLRWHPASDYFTFKISIAEDEMLSKRKLLSELAKIYDPLGFLAPITIRAKLLFQSLWKNNSGWDQPVTGEVLEKWSKYQSELELINAIKIDRCVILTKASFYTYHVFCDASEQAYAAIVYLRSGNSEEVKVAFIAAKTRVAPLKKLSLPRLELCGALLASRLIQSIRKAMRIKEGGVHMYCDSMIVLAWIKAEAEQWKPFVANRVREIQGNVSDAMWHYVNSKENPADFATRGLSTISFLSKQQWWNGPQWLSSMEKDEFSCSNSIPETNEETRVKQVTVYQMLTDINLLERYSSLFKLQRVTAWCFRFYNNLKCARDKRNKGGLSLTELNSALVVWIKIAQEEHFHVELTALRKGLALSSKSRVLSLNPFLDHKGLLRVGGRLVKSNLSEDKKHPILLPQKHYLTKLIIKQTHVDNLHAESLLLLNTLQQKFWIINARTIIRSIVRQCIICHRYKAEVVQQLMGNLPEARVNPSPSFTHCGLDFAGPLMLKPMINRSRVRFKSYICLFICYSTRAIHLELVSNLSTEAFLACLKRFIARRGKPSHLYSDCGTNFLGASLELKKMAHEISLSYQNSKVSNFLNEQGTEWHFNPPAAPHFGGLWEAGVRSVKFHLKRVMGNAILNIEELITVLNQIEACLNSRPLTPLSSHPLDFSALTPGHFLIGAPLNAMPEPNLIDLNFNRLNRWQMCQSMLQHFWKRWSSEYITRLQQRPKWWLKKNNLKIGDLVLIKENFLPPLKWKMGRVIELHPGSDNLVRAVTLKCENGQCKRAISKLSLLPLDQD